MNSSYNNYLNYGNLFESIIFITNPKLIVEFGILDGYSLNHFIENTTTDTKIYAYDIFDEFNGNHANSSITKKYDLKKNVIVEYGNFYEKYNYLEDNSIDILHIDIANSGKTYEFALKNYINKLSKKGVMVLEGGSEQRDNVYWMDKYNKSKINPILKKYENKLNIKTIGNFPSITLIQKK